ncbi:NADH:flavin oxidoreductase [Parasphaerochaeta coccoides]|uniref:NADH:flavin oxidoreductase/NADH oxidase n=1 Tax=Parasphaerochaeta coccoides (strain ATCC BAA-1237 / DSM 17374 / SPN1) TaxID=760011 RepID=F4GJM9_PARC1|nr:NADH:flavin oxidoreductase [Parasphaerochaeta coccoides]AEC02776.1 NADH:flavin oxidoreductase/NADH oxidase [Parasphaerochaeta coccoides DSM 17374]
MPGHERFCFPLYEDLEKRIEELGVDITLQEDLSVLASPVVAGKKRASNSIAILPMEGCDSEPDGSPSELVTRRYTRFAKGGAGLIWWEANAVVPEGRANPLQMMLTKDNLSAFAHLLSVVNNAASEANGKNHRPLHILQLTHSGRYSRPIGHKAAPLVPQHDPLLDSRVGIDSHDDSVIVTDEYIDSLVPHYIQSALMAREAGFDGVDIKACHRYLISELLASHTRAGKYGGSFENRTRLLLDIIRGVKEAAGDDFIIASRFNIFDAHPYPYGFGEDAQDFWKFNPDEPVRLVKEMCAAGVGLLSNSAGNPYYIYPQVTRPFDISSQGIPVPNEHPLESIARLFRFSRLVQEAAGSVPVVGNGYTWLRHYLPYAGAANIAAKSCSFIGLGRMAIAYPDAPRDIIMKGKMESGKCCITCSKCTQIMRDHGRTGCVIKDSAVYAPLYKEARQDAESRAAGT